MSQFAAESRVEKNSNVTSSTSELIPCADLPSGQLTDEQLAELVTADSPGRVRVAWKTESQEETYGFNIMRSDSADGKYAAINSTIIPGEGTSNIPKGYCFEDSGLKRGAIFYYQIQEITNSGSKTIVEGTAATRVQVKTVAEEREWLKKKAAANATPLDSETSAPK